jgi:hypothetical protein
MAEAIFGLVGVVVGALITGGTEYVMRKRDERAQLRAAARLGYAYFRTREWELAHAVREHAWLVLSGKRLTKPEWWSEYEALFARLLSPAEWEALHEGLLQARAVGWRVHNFVERATDKDREELARHSFEYICRVSRPPPARRVAAEEPRCAAPRSRRPSSAWRSHPAPRR